MKQLIGLTLKVIDYITVISGWIAAICTPIAALVITHAIISRKIFGVSTIWQTEAAIYLLICTVFVGAGFVQKKEHHLNVDLLLVYLPSKIREILNIFTSILGCALAGVIAWYAWPMWWQSVVENQHSESLWGPPLYIPLFLLPLGMTILFLQYISYLYRKISDYRDGRIDENIERLELRDI